MADRSGARSGVRCARICVRSGCAHSAAGGICNQPLRAPVPAYALVHSAAAMTILLANTWTPACAGSGLLQSDAVPHYLAAFIAALLAARPDDDGRGKPRVRFLLRRADDMHALQAAVAPLLQSGAWEAAIVPAADDVPALERALHGARVVLWADDGRGHQLMRDGRVLLHLAAHMGVQRFVFRSQVQPNTGSKAADEGIALYVPSFARTAPCA
jgi:hypothetical protein